MTAAATMTSSKFPQAGKAGHGRTNSKSCFSSEAQQQQVPRYQIPLWPGDSQRELECLGQPFTHGADPSAMQHAPASFLVLVSSHLSSALNFYFDFTALLGEQWIFIKAPQQHTHHKHHFPQSFKTLPHPSSQPTKRQRTSQIRWLGEL